MKKEICEIINNKLSEKAIDIKLIKSIIKGNPKEINSQIKIPLFKDLNLKK